MNEIGIAEQIASSQYVWAILFIVGIFVAYKATKNYLVDIKQENAAREEEIKELYKEHRLEAKERERDLMNHLEKSNESQERTAQTLERIEKNLNHLEVKVDKGFNDVWSVIENENK